MLFRSLAGKVATLSYLMNDGNLVTGTATITKGTTTLFVNNSEGQSYINGSGGLQFYRNAGFGCIAIKLELGSQQTLAHQENGNWVLNEIPDYGEQLARCQRYFYRFPQIGNVYTDFGIGLVQSATSFYCDIKPPVSMRDIPSIVGSGSFRLLSADFNTVVPVTSIDYQVDTKSASSDLIKIRAMVSSGLTAGSPMYLQANNDPSAHIDFIADL